MKKLFACIATALMALSAQAQTEFRNLSYTEAIAAAKAEGKPVFIDFYTSWCGPCKMMARDVFPQKAAGDYFNTTFVTIKLDAEKEGKEAAEKFGVTAYPTFKVISADEQEIYTVVGANTDVNAFIADIKVGTNPELTPAKMKARYEQGDRTPQLVEAYANSIYKEATSGRKTDEAKRDEAKKMVTDYFDTLSPEQRVAKENFFVYSYNYTSSPMQPAARFLVENRSKFATDQQADVEETLKKLYNYRIGTLLQGIDKPSTGELTQVQEDIAAIGLYKGKEEATKAAFNLLRAMEAGDAATTLAVMRKNFPVMDDNFKATAVMSIASWTENASDDVKHQTAQWLRSQLADLDPGSIYIASMTLLALEGQR